MKTLSLVQAAAIAAERRLQYEICCGSQSGGDYEVAKNIVQHKGKNKALHILNANQVCHLVIIELFILKNLECESV
ncbi:hypothetical protein AAZX31_02G004900 [Glycine max]